MQAIYRVVFARKSMLVFLFMIGLGCLISGSSISVSASTLSLQMDYVYERNGNLWLTDSTGTSHLQVTTSGHNSNPIFSPSKEYVAYLSIPVEYLGSAPTPQNICILEISSLNSNCITHEPALRGKPVWSPDGSWLAYVENQKLVVSRMDRLERKVLAMNVASDGPLYAPIAWSPDGNMLTTVLNADGEISVWIIDPANGPQRQLMKTEQPYVYAPLAFSPDGKSIVTINVFDEGRLWTIPTNGAAPTRISATTNLVLDFSWSLSADQILYSRTDGTIWILNIRNGITSELQRSIGQEAPPSVDWVSTNIILLSSPNAPGTDLFVYDLNTGIETQLTPIALHPQVSLGTDTLLLSKVISAPFEWYRYQGASDSGTCASDNCGPTSVAMAIQFAKNNQWVSISDIRNQMTGGSCGWTNLDQIRSSLGHWGVNYTTITGMDAVRDAVNARGHIVIVPLTMSYIPRASDYLSSNSDPSNHYNRFYSFDGGHILVVKGISDDNNWVIVHDPDVWNGNGIYWYSDSTAKGRNRYYNYSNFASAFADNGNTAIEILNTPNTNTCDASSLPAGYIKCADENGTCSFSGTKQVYYGASSCYAVRSFTNSVMCNNNNFGDPAPNNPKACYIQPDAPTCPQSGGVILYWNANYDCSNSNGDAGYRLRSNTGSQNVNDGQFNDQASSVKIPSGWSVRLFNDPNGFGGNGSICYASSVNDFASQGNFPGTSTSINDRVSSIEVFNNSSCSGGASPNVPLNLRNTNSTPTSITMTWDDVSDETGYKIYQWNGSSFVYLAQVGANVTSYTETRSSCGWTNRYAVTAYNSYGESSLSDWEDGSAQNCPLPAVPSNLRNTNSTSTSITITWNDVSDESGYKIYQWNGSSFVYLATASANSTTYTETRSSCGWTNRYAVTAYNGYGESDLSDWEDGYALACSNPPGAFNKNGPSNNSTGQSTSPSLAWGPSSGAAGYEYCIDTTNDNACNSWVSNSANTSITLSNLPGGTTYYWHVRANNSDGTTYSNGSPTAFWSFTTQTSPPSPPSLVEATQGDYTDRVQLLWLSSMGATRYEVWRHTSNSSGSASRIADNVTGNNAVIEYNDISSTLGSTYYYWIKACNASGCSSFSSPVYGYRVGSSSNLLLNGGFEEGSNNAPAWWNSDVWTLAFSTFTWDNTQRHSGTRSIKISNNTANDARWIQTAYVQTNTEYRLSGWIKTQNVAQSQEVNNHGANLSTLSPFWTNSSGLLGTNDWTYFYYTFNTGSSTEIDVAARLGTYSGTTTGVAWFDDLKLEFVSTPACYSLTMNRSPNGSGSILLDPPPNCNAGTQYIHGTVVKLTASPAPGYSFDNWSGDVTGSINPSYVTMITNHSVTANFKSGGADTTGVFRPSNGLLYLKNRNTTGFADIAINYGIGGDYPVVGDWDGDGSATIGVYRNGKFMLRNSNTIGFADMVFAFGQIGDQPVAGDWDGDGIDTIGIYRPWTGQFLLRNSNTAGAADTSFYLGNVGDVGIAGDWDGDRIDTTGVFRPSNGIIFLKNKNETGFADVALNYGIPGDRPVTGDWDNDGIDTIGVYRNGQFLLRNSNTVGFADLAFGLGNPGDMPIAGNWDGKP